MILDRLPRWLLRLIVRLYQQDWYHWFASILLGFWDTLFGVIYRAEEHLFHISLWKDWQNRPSPPYPIPMSDNDIPVKPERSDAAGQYIATMITHYADAAELQAILPPDAELDPAHIHNGKHSIVYMLGYTQNLRRVWNPLPGINRNLIADWITKLRFDASNRGDDAFFVFRKPAAG